ncbi:hypothetical protein [Psychrosphaera algicola]|uniref:Lipoprotein n=1 Tax=Psychrosphaera algicola TaxID=3023714 RepID=A0ABT5FB43_9GAMM|nr:hypothetical protein [Psychrosphaera sp. G1-22]MDC2888766.1 hypothetical protein [Psychrosphaera sp. G1-22]
MQFYTKLKFTRVCLLTSMVLSALMLTGCLTTEEAKQEATIKVKKARNKQVSPTSLSSLLTIKGTKMLVCLVVIMLPHLI